MRWSSASAHFWPIRLVERKVSDSQRPWQISLLMHDRYVDATWDLEEVERDWKEKIIAQGPYGALVTKLALP